MLFVPGMRVNKLSVSPFEDEGYGIMVRSNHVFLCQRDDPVGTTILLGDCRDKLYVLIGHIVRPGAGGWLSKSEDEARVESERHGSDEESDSLQSTSKRLSQSSHGVDEQVDEAQVSGFRVPVWS